MSRREVLAMSAAATAVAAVPARLIAWAAPARGRVVVASGPDRARAVGACLETFDFRGCDGRHVAVKANFNSDDAFPASTHPDTLAALLGALRARKAAHLTLAERCALDAAAIALLRLHGMRGPAARGSIARTDQLARALALGLGAPPERVDVVAADPGARDTTRRLADALAEG